MANTHGRTFLFPLVFNGSFCLIGMGSPLLCRWFSPVRGSGTDRLDLYLQLKKIYICKEEISIFSPDIPLRTVEEKQNRPTDFHIQGTDPGMNRNTRNDSAPLLKPLLASLVALIWWLTPETAHAWGPVTHLHLGLEALRNLGLFEHSLRMVLQSFPYDYLYGCIAADIIFAKGLAKLHEHSHNWTVAFGVLEEASTPQQEAFAYGYLSHLAADVVAHNFFIPESVVKSYSSKTFRHIYWEVRFDALAKRELWDLSREIARLPQHDEDDQLLEQVVKRTLFSFKTDKRIFHSLLILNRMEQWQKMLKIHSKKSPWQISKTDVTRYQDLSLQATLDFLVQERSASCVQMDPTGKGALFTAKWIRKNLKMLERRGKLEPKLYLQALRSLQPQEEAEAVSLSAAS